MCAAGSKRVLSSIFSLSAYHEQQTMPIICVLLIVTIYSSSTARRKNDKNNEYTAKKSFLSREKNIYQPYHYLRTSQVI